MPVSLAPDATPSPQQADLLRAALQDPQHRFPATAGARPLGLIVGRKWATTGEHHTLTAAGADALRHFDRKQRIKALQDARMTSRLLMGEDGKARGVALILSRPRPDGQIRVRLFPAGMEGPETELSVDVDFLTRMPQITA
ncbi:hypothetical protein [Streptomyces sp. NBC_01361]|uniref:hypothetical protein n=1 Tax=Streptomyces sp. NBC_01361 TaxID=2903838 RepID=UPI002E311F00|nr:hypothetical protein [Streptomyces sp. NBC_01361]